MIRIYLKAKICIRILIQVESEYGSSTDFGSKSGYSLFFMPATITTTESAKNLEKLQFSCIFLIFLLIYKET